MSVPNHESARAVYSRRNHQASAGSTWVRERATRNGWDARSSLSSLSQWGEDQQRGWHPSTQSQGLKCLGVICVFSLWCWWRQYGVHRMILKSLKMSYKEKAHLETAVPHRNWYGAKNLNSSLQQASAEHWVEKWPLLHNDLPQSCLYYWEQIKHFLCNFPHYCYSVSLKSWEPPQC